jgi:nitronate monooxygenase
MNRVMREVGPIAEIAPEFPLAATGLAPLRSKAEAAGSGDFTALWAGQGFPMGREMSAGELTRKLAEPLHRSRFTSASEPPS